MLTFSSFETIIIYRNRVITGPFRAQALHLELLAPSTPALDGPDKRYSNSFDLPFCRLYYNAVHFEKARFMLKEYI